MNKFRSGETVYDIIGNKYLILSYEYDFNWMSGKDEIRYHVKSDTCINERAWEDTLYSVEEYRDRILKTILN